MTNEKLNKIYDTIIYNQKLSSSKLAEIGLNPNDVLLLINNNILSRDDKGIFYLSNMDNLFSYGKQLIINDEDEKAIKFFEKCLDSKINIDGSLFNLFYLNIKKKNYEKAFEYFKQNFGDENYINDDKYDLYLLSMIIKLPDEYKQIVNDITFDDICTNDEKQNQIRLLSLNKEFDLALEKYDEFINMNKCMTYHDAIVKNLLNSCLIKQKTQNCNVLKDKKLSKSDDEINFFLDEIFKLLCNDIGQSIELIKKYLKQINKEQYLCLIINFIEIDLVYGNNFSNSFKFLKKIIKDDFILDINLCLKKFNKLIQYNNREVLIFYLDILSHIQNIKVEYKEKLNGYLKSDYKDNINIKEYVKSHMEQLQTTGILYLKIDNKNIKELFKIIDDMPVLPTMIGYNEFILRYTKFNDENMDLKQLMNLGKQSYYDKDYKACINYLKKVISFTQPSPYVYLYLGLANLKLYNLSLAATYLTIATKLGEEEIDFTNLINRFMGKKISNHIDDDYKKYAEFRNSEFNDKIIYNDNMVNVVDMMNNGVSFDIACQNLDENDKNCVALNLAIDYYRQGEFEYGDYYLAKVEHSKNKSEFVRKKLLDVKRDKKFYQNRADDSYEPLLKKLIK